MPSKNSINRPKLTVNLHRKVHSLAKKRAQRERAGLLQPARSSLSSKSGHIKSVPLDLYFQDKEGKVNSGPLTTKTLSKKRAKKIERNLKYAEQRKLLTDIQAKLEQEDGMDLDVHSADNTKIVKDEKKSALTRMKDALWSIIDDTSSQGLILENGQGTTLGGPFFP